MNRSAPTRSPHDFDVDAAAVAALRSSRPRGHGPVPAYDWITHHRAHRPGKEAVREVSPPRSLSYGDLDARADALAVHLGSLGIGRGDRVALLAHNGVEYFDLQFACGRSGAIAVLLNWRLTVPELDYILKDCTPRLLIHDVEFTEAAQALQRQCGIAALLCIDKRGGAAANAYEAALNACRGQPAPRQALTHDDVVTIMYTSGTTGHPKGAMITHGMNLWNCINLGTPAGVGRDTVHLSVLPLFHTGGLNCYSNPVLHAGGTVVLTRGFDAGQALQLIGDPAQGITHFFAVPAPYQFMAQHPDFATTDLSRLRSAGVGGAPCALPILQAWAERGAAAHAGLRHDGDQPGLHLPGPGRRDPQARLHRQGADAHRSAHRRRHGRGLRTRRDRRALGGRAEHHARLLEPPRRHRSRLRGALAEDRRRRTHRRRRLLLHRRPLEGHVHLGGENVYPAEVENVLYQLPQVAEAAVIGVPSEEWGEVGLAVLALKPGQALDKDQVLGHCSGRLARFKEPHDIAFIAALPRNATGKVLKRELRKHFLGGDAPAIS